MKAILLDSDGLLSLDETNAPTLFPEGVRIAVKAVGMNRADILQAAGHYPAPVGVRSDILGLEYAGEVIEVGAAVRKWGVGDRVMGIVPGASYAEEVVTHALECMRIPAGLSWVEAAAIPEAFLTAYDALNQLSVRAGQSILVHAIGSGVGNAASQLCRVSGLHCIGTTRTERKLEPAAYYGMDTGIWVREGEFLSLLRETHEHVDGIIDFIGSAYLNQNLGALRSRGTMIVVGLLGGRIGDFDMGKLLRKRLCIRGTVLRSRGLEEKIALTQDFEHHMLPFFEQRKLQPVVDRVFDMADVDAAHSMLVRNKNVGKVIAKW